MKNPEAAIFTWREVAKNLRTRGGGGGGTLAGGGGGISTSLHAMSSQMCWYSIPKPPVQGINQFHLQLSTFCFICQEL